MQLYELTITTLIQSNLHFTQINEKLSQLINGAMHLDRETAQMHVQSGYKHYCYGNLYPIEKDKQYKADKVYLFKIRTLENSFADKMYKQLPNTNNTNFKVLAIEKKQYTQKHITTLETLTPALATIDNKHWVSGDSFMQLQDRIQSNLEKKYKAFYGEELKPEQCFIKHLEILNHKPICFKYKNTSLIGNKLRIHVSEDPASQKLAFMALAVGLLEKNSSAGLGFCSAK